MSEQIIRLLFGPSTCLRLASSRSITICQVVNASPPCTNLQKVFLLLGLFVLTAMPMVWIGTAIAATPYVSVNLKAGEPGLDEEEGTLFIALPIVNGGAATGLNVQVQSIE